MMGFIFDDGGRAAADYRGQARDCVVRAITIATEQPYQDVYDALFALNHQRRNRGARRKTSPRDGNTHKQTIRKYMESLGWRWVPTMHVGSGCRVHLRRDELPTGRLVVSLSRHLAAVVDGVIHDTHDPSRNGTRCVYGYFTARAEGKNT